MVTALQRLLASSALATTASASVLAITLNVNTTSLLQGATFRLDYKITCDDPFNATHALLYPYFSGLQWGPEAGLLSATSDGGAGFAFLPLPPFATGSQVTFQLAIHAAPQTFTTGMPVPPGALLSNAVQLSVAPRAPQRPAWATPSAASSSPLLPAPLPLLGMYLETWFTPLNMNWAGGTDNAEAIPMIGRYASVNLDSIRQQAWWLITAGVDAVVVDWTNNIWGAPSWNDRPSNILELVNATSLHLGVYASLKRNEGWPVPKFVLLLGLNNGPSTPIPALQGELDFIQQAYLNNATLGPDMFVQYEGKTLVILFDGSGTGSSTVTNLTHPAFTIRWMSSQNQNSGFNNKGYWSWMDGSVQPELTYVNGTTPEAATVDPAYFADGGWTNAALAMGRSGGLTYVMEVASVLERTVGRGQPPPAFLFTCQWNEFAGSPNGAAGYYDSYSADLSNDIEPTSPYGCGYPRAGVACGGYGYRPMNILAMMSAAARDAAYVDGSAMVSILTPAVGAWSNFTSSSGSSTITVSWVATSFNATSLASGGPLAFNVSLPVVVAVDGVAVGTYPPTVTSIQLDVDTAGPDGSPLDRSYPHILTVTAQESSPGAQDHLTAWPLSFDYFDEAAPLAKGQWVPAMATAWVRLPESGQV